MSDDDGKDRRSWGVKPNSLALWTVVYMARAALNDTIRLLLGR